MIDRERMVELAESEDKIRAEILKQAKILKGKIKRLNHNYDRFNLKDYLPFGKALSKNMKAAVAFSKYYGPRIRQNLDTGNARVTNSYKKAADQALKSGFIDPRKLSPREVTFITRAIVDAVDNGLYGILNDY